MWKVSIRTKLIFLLSIVLIPIIVLYIVRVQSFYKDNLENELESSRRLIESISTAFMNYIEEIWTQETTLNSIFTRAPELQQSEIQYYLMEALKNQNSADVYSWTSPEGIIIESTRSDLIGKSIKEREYFQRILKGEDKVVSDLVIGYSTKKPVIPIVKAARKDGKLIGCMVAIIDAEMLGEKLLNPFLIKESRFGIVDRNCKRVYQSDILYYPSDDMEVPEDSPLRHALKGDVVMLPKGKSHYDGSLRMGVFIPIREIGWACYVSTPYDSIMGKHNKQLRNDFAVLALVTLISLFTAFLLNRKILLRLNSLKKAVNMMVDGNYSARANIEGSDEIAVTAQAFDRMAAGIENYDKLKTQFFTNLSHELKTPINVIFASVQLISQRKADVETDIYFEKLQKHIKIVKQNCYRLIRLVTNLIDITRYDSGFLSIRPCSCNIVQIVEDITMSVVKYAAIKDVEVQFDTEIEEKYIVCDPDIIERIILNLFSNSLKFTNVNGSISVNVLNKENSVVIKLKDTGIGIPPDQLNIIFERFRQVDTSLNRNYEGSGIGLSLVKALVESHKGTVSVSSTVGKGTEFTIELPTDAFPEQSCSCSSQSSKPQGMIDRINIEFSDIYSFSDIE